MKNLETHDMQGLLLSGYGHLLWASYRFYRITDPQAARAWLAKAADEVTLATGKCETHSVNLALTARGLRRLRLDEDALASFSRPFRQGMATQRRSRVLGDTDDDSCPQAWQWGRPDTRERRGNEVDILLMLFASEEHILEERCAQWRSLAEGAMEEVASVQSWRPPKGDEEEEPFGFTDGLSQPVLRGSPGAHKIPKGLARWVLVNPGEIVLGYPDNSGKRAEGPTVDARQDPYRLLLSGPPGRRDLGRNGSYLVARQLVQDVDGFQSFLDAEATRKDAVRNRERVAAELMGRWRSGAPLVHAPERDREDLKRHNAFGYHDTDPHGFACPIGSHVRRANPRDSLDPKHPRTALRSANRHRILRRGRPYGSPFFAPRADGGDAERGLLFLALNSDIERQFEFVQQQWINNPSFGGLQGEGDPLLSTSEVFTEPQDPVRRRIKGLKRFVTVKGGAYFFLPGLRALRYLASLPG